MTGLECGHNSVTRPSRGRSNLAGVPIRGWARDVTLSQNIKDGEHGEWYVPANGGTRALPLPPATATAHPDGDTGTRAQEGTQEAQETRGEGKWREKEASNHRSDGVHGWAETRLRGRWRGTAGGVLKMQ